MTESERIESYAELKRNLCFIEFMTFLRTMKEVSKSNTKVDLMSLGNGAILAREHHMGMHQAFEGMEAFILQDLPAETPTLAELKVKLAEKKQQQP